MKNYAKEFLILCDIDKNVCWMLMFNAGKLQIVNFLKKKTMSWMQDILQADVYNLCTDWLFYVQGSWSWNSQSMHIYKNNSLYLAQINILKEIS